MKSSTSETFNLWSRKLSRSLLGITLASTTAIGYHRAAQALTFDFSYDPGTSLEQMIGFEMAGQVWSSYLDDDITVNIHVGVTDLLPDNVIGGALPGLTAYQNYGNFRNEVYQDRTSSDDNTAYNNLHNYQYSDGYTRYRGYLENNTWHNKNIALTNANAKALGITPSNNLDGYILMSDLSAYSVDWNYDYSRQNSMGSNELDFLSVAMHEIGHVLGFVSGIDSTEVAETQATYNQNVERLMHTTSLDMYRYSDWSDDNGGYLDLAYGVDSYFSIDGGDTALAHFSEGEDLLLGFGGDGFQGSHWEKKSDPIGIMDPDLALGERANISDMDLRAFDVIGYDCAHFNYSGSYSSCDAPSLNFSSLEYDAKDSLAKKVSPLLGAWSVDAALATGLDDFGASLIDSDRTDDINQMIIDSEIYEWGWGDNCDPNVQNCGNSQVIAAMLTNKGSGFNWSTLGDLTVAEVPEPGTNLGIIALSLLAGGSVLKRHRK